MIKAVTVFSGARDQYQLPIALAEADLLEAFVTDLYFPGDQAWFNTTFGRVIPDYVLKKRFTPKLKSHYVQLSKLALAAAFVKYVLPSVDVDQFKSSKMELVARKRAGGTGSALLAYSNNAYEAFMPGTDQPEYRFLFSIQAHPMFFQRILQREIEVLPITEGALERLYGNNLRDDTVQKRAREIELANGWIAPSSFVAETLQEANIRKDRIKIVPYGVNHDVFFRQYPRKTKKVFRIIFVGHITQLKGLTYLLEAVRTLRSRFIEIVLCTPLIVDHKILKLYDDIHIQVNVALSHYELAQQFNQADICVLPSLADGFGLVILEAMSCGVPVITTTNTGGPDVLVNAEHGFIIPIRSAEAIAEKLSWAIDHNVELNAMGDAAASQARKFTWDRFRQSVRAAYNEMIKEADIATPQNTTKQ